MGIFLATFAYLLLCGVGYILTNRYIKPWVPPGVRSSRWGMRTIGFVFALTGAYFIMAWGYNPTVITLGMQQLILNPLRWLSWLLSALCLGVSESFVVEILREVRPKADLNPKYLNSPRD